MKHLLTSCLSALLLALSLACGDLGDPLISTADPPSPTPPLTSTDGPIWVLEILNGAPVIEGMVLTLSTSGDSAGGVDGCNSFAGSHEDGSLVAGTDGTISFPGFSRTLALCEHPPGTVAQQDSYRAALADGTEYRILGDRLEVRDSSGKVRLVLANRSPLVGAAVDLTGTAWRLVSSDGQTPRGSPPTLAFWDPGFMGGIVASYGFVARLDRYDWFEPYFHVRTIAITGAGTGRISDVQDQDVVDFFRDIRHPAGFAVREEGGTRFLRIRTDRGLPMDFEELAPAVGNISDVVWRLQSFIEVREEESRAGGAPCVQNVLRSANIIAKFTETNVSGTVGERQYVRDDLRLSAVRPGESDEEVPEDRDTDLIQGRCPTAKREEASELAVPGQVERFLKLLPVMRRYMIFGDRLVVISDSQQVLLFKSDGSE